jgi:hypothetical protein
MRDACPTRREVYYQSNPSTLLTRGVWSGVRSFGRLDNRRSDPSESGEVIGLSRTGAKVSDETALYPSWEFAVRTAKSVLALLSVIGRISLATRRFVQVQLYGGN